MPFEPSDRRIVLHAGLPKTGTSTIQNVLHANRELLLGEDILYPSLMVNHTTPLRAIFRDLKNGSPQPIAHKMAGLSAKQDAERTRGYLESIESEAARDWNTLLLSAEGVANMPRHEFAALKEWGDKYAPEWTVIVCVRHPLRYVGSVVPQMLKQGDTLEGMYREPPLPCFRNRISAITSVFGRENVRVFDFDAAAASKGGIVGAFADAADIPGSTRDALVCRAERVNESLSFEAAHILDALNRKRPLFDDNGRVPRRAGPGRELPYLRRIEGKKFDLPEPVKEKVRAESREDVLWLNQTFGLDLYRDIVDRQGGVQEYELPAPDPAIEGIAEVFGELVAENAYHRNLQAARRARDNGNPERAIGRLQEAVRLDPDAREPKRMLRELRNRRTKRP